MRKWLIENWRVLESREESQYFAAELALIVAAASKHCGRYRIVRCGSTASKQTVTGCEAPSVFECALSYLRLAVLYELRSYREVLQGLPALKEDI